MRFYTCMQDNRELPAVSFDGGRTGLFLCDLGIDAPDMNVVIEMASEDWKNDLADRGRKNEALSFSLENLNKTIDPLVGARHSGFCSQGSRIPEAGPSRRCGADCHSEKSERERPLVCFLPRACCCGASRRGSGSGTWVQVLPNPKPVSELMILTGGIKRSPTSTSWNLFIPHIGSESR